MTRFEDLNWMDVEAYLKKENRLLIVLGACEQHGYLSLTADSSIPLALADSASQKTGVIIAPVMNFGVSPYFTSYPGSISLRLTTFLQVVGDLVRSVYGYGFRKLLFLNGHGGNNCAQNMLVELANELPGLKTAFYSWWLSHSVEVFAQNHALKCFHAGWVEAFPFTRVCELPRGEKNPPSFKGVLNAEETRQVYGDGVFGGKYQVDEPLMGELFDVCLQDVLYLLDF